MNRIQFTWLQLGGALLLALTSALALGQDAADAAHIAEMQRLAMMQASMNQNGAWMMRAMPMVLSLAFVGMALLFVRQREKHRQELLTRFIDKGQEIPAHLLPQPASRQCELRRGTWLMALGIGLGLVLLITSGDRKVVAWSLIPLFLGVASFINAALFYRDPGSRN